MMATSMLDYVHELKAAGVSDQQSEIHARRLAQAMASIKEEMDEDIRKSELVTKKDLELSIEKIRAEIQQTRYEMLKFTVWTGVSSVVVIAGMLAKGFHWF